MKLPTKNVMSEFDYELLLIQQEIDFLQNYKQNLKRFAFYEMKRVANFSKKYYKILDEVERVAIEVHKLEIQKTQLKNNAQIG